MNKNSGWWSAVKIDSSNISFLSSSAFYTYQKTSVSVKIVSSEESREASSGLVLLNLENSAVSVKQESISADELKQLIIRTLIEKLTGKKLKSLNMSELMEDLYSTDVPNIKEYGAEINVQEIYYQKQEVNFKAFGYVKTSDGRQIHFQVDFSLKKEVLQYSKLSIKAGSAAVVDPLVINLDGEIDDMLGDSFFRFDIDGDGEEEDIPELSAGNGFLVFDRNENGTVDSGKELFGTQTGDGFGEISAFDADKNGWIDENDPVFKKLGFWSPAEGRIKPLEKLGIGALYLKKVETPFVLPEGIIQHSGIYLTEDGSAGTVVKLDFFA